MVATSPVQYIDDYLSGIGDLNRTRVSVDRRLVVEDDDIRGRDYIYSYLRLLDPEDPASGSTRFRGRVQVFVHGGYIKAAAAEGPAGEFDAMMQEIVEPFFLSFHPKLEPVGGEEGRNGGEAVPSSAAPNRPRVNEGARTPSQTRYF